MFMLAAQLTPTTRTKFECVILLGLKNILSRYVLQQRGLGRSRTQLVENIVVILI